MEEFDFTEDEIQEQLQQLGYYHVPRDRLRDFKKDLEDLVRHEKSRNSSWTTVDSGGSRDEELFIQQNNHLNGYHREIQTANYMSRPRDVDRQTKLDVHLPKSSSNGPYIHIGRDAHGTSNEYSLFSTDETPTNHYDTTLDTTTSTERKVIKRKVLRKVDGRSQVFDESSVTESETDLSYVEDRLRALPLSEDELQRPKTAPSGQRRRMAWQDDYAAPSNRPQTARADVPCYRLPEDYLGPKALIRPMTVHPNEKCVKKNDPVAKYQHYKKSWTSQKAPGEKNHKNLRWSVREQMLYHDEVVEKKPQKVFIPNNYKVPSDKKRKNLRWNIRTDLAQGVVPPSLYD